MSLLSTAEVLDLIKNSCIKSNATPRSILILKTDPLVEFTDDFKKSFQNLKKGTQDSTSNYESNDVSREEVEAFIPIRCPDKNAFVESFFSIFETEFLQVRYFADLVEVHRQGGEWIERYNVKRLHGSLKYKSPEMFIELFKSGLNYEYEVSA